MTKATIYGIKNCDTMKKAIKWLDARGVAYDLHDYKKQGVDEHVLRSAIDECGWDNVINRRGTTWRKLPAETQDAMDAQSAFDIAIENPSIIKRPLLVYSGQIHLGFKDDIYAGIFG